MLLSILRWCVCVYVCSRESKRERYRDRQREEGERKSLENLNLYEREK